jgi:hypothetical protein
VQIGVGRLLSADNARFSSHAGRRHERSQVWPEAHAQRAVWFSKIDNEPISSVKHCCQSDGGRQRPDRRGRSFRLRRDAGGVQVIEEIDLKKLPPEGDQRQFGTTRRKGGDASTFMTGDPTRSTSLVYTGYGVGAGKDAMGRYPPCRGAVQSELYQQQYHSAAAVVYIAKWRTSNPAGWPGSRRKGESNRFVGRPTLRDAFGTDIVVMITEMATGDYSFVRSDRQCFRGKCVRGGGEALCDASWIGFRMNSDISWYASRPYRITWTMHRLTAIAVTSDETNVQDALAHNDGLQFE